jgi:probable F420-dependent oxidoreductase
MRLGVNTEIAGLAPPRMVELGVLAERLGYDDAWSSESGGVDGITPLAALAAATRRVRLGTAILPIGHRTPALAAMTAASLQALSAGRFVLGLGLSTRYIVERWLGQSHDRPLLRMREYLTAVRDLLAGRTVDVAGATLSVRGFRLKAPPEPRVPVYMAALGPRACRLAGAVADGVIFFLKSPAGVRQALAWVHEGAADAGRDPALVEPVLTVAVTRGPRAAEQARACVAGYARVPDYARSLRLQGFAAEVAAIEAGWADGRERAERSVGAAMAEALVLRAGGADGDAALTAFAAAGIRTVLLLPTRPLEPGAESFDNAAMVLKAFAPRVVPA